MLEEQPTVMEVAGLRRCSSWGWGELPRAADVGTAIVVAYAYSL
jgi:hypothetical protein